MRRTRSLAAAPLSHVGRALLGAAGVLLTLLAASTASAQYTAYGLAQGAGGQTLVRFQTNAPGVVTTVGATGASLVGIDFRPANGVLYGYDGSNLFTVNTSTGAATFLFDVGNYNGGNAGVDFNPMVDLLRITAGNSVNLRVNPVNGATTTDPGPTYIPGDPNAAEATIITGVGYTNNDNDPGTGTTLYGVDGPLGILTRFISPNAGTVMTVGSLGIGLQNSINGFDIVTVGTMNFAFLTSTSFAAPQTPNFYSVNLDTGAATLIGALGGTGPLAGLAIAPVAVPEPGTYVLLAGGLAMLGGVAARRRRSH